MASEYLKTNQMLLRGCILFQCAEGKPIFDAYKQFCKVMGDDTMDYIEFEYWFMRFSRGEFDLNYDRSLDIKYSRSLCDMPVELIAKIMEDFTWKDVLSLRQVSQSFEPIVDDIKFPFKKIYFLLCVSGASLSVDNLYDDYKTEITKSDKEDSDDVWIKTMKRGLRDVKILMSIPKIHLEQFRVSNVMYTQKYQDLYSTNKSSVDLTGNVLKTRRISLDCCNGFDWIQRVEPGTLEEIEIEYDPNVFDFNTQILETEQWKQAKTLIIKRYLHAIPIKHLIHFVRIDVPFFRLGVDYFLELKNALFKSPNFEKCRIMWRYDQPWEDQQFNAVGKEFGMSNLKAPNDPYYYPFVIEHDNKTFVIKTGSKMVEIERTS